MAILSTTSDAFIVPQRQVATRTASHQTFSAATTTLQATPLLDSILDHSNIVLASTDTAVGSTNSDALWAFFWETLISNGIPAVFTLLLLALAAKLLRGSKDDALHNLDESLFSQKNPASMLYNDLYGDQDQSRNKKSKNPLQFLFSSAGKPSSDSTLPQNIGIPATQYIRMTHLNRKYDSYQYSLTAALQSKAAAAAQYRRQAFGRAWRQAVAGSAGALQRLEQDFLRKGQGLLAELQALQAVLTQTVVDQEIQSMMTAGSGGNGDPSLYPVDVAVNGTTTKKANHHHTPKPKKTVSTTDTMNKIQKLQRSLQELELNFVKDVVKAVGPEQGAAVRTALLGDIAVRGSGSLLQDLQDRPLNKLLLDGDSTNTKDAADAAVPDGTSSSQSGKKLFVTRFLGDVSASQVSNLREEVTAIIGSARPGVDEAVVVLQTGGGTVTGYGLAAAQLQRFKAAGIKLTIAVEQVAASGGYMMCCVADRIVASPFAVLGSIGVISDIPNVYQRLKDEGIEFQTVTAGKYKRTLTPTKKVTKEDFEKSKADVEEILVLFRDFVKENRPQLDIDAVATGETWFGKDALDRKLCDEIKTVDDVLMEYVGDGYDAYEVEYKPPVETPFGKLVPANAAASETGSSGLIGQGIRWLIQTVAAEVKAEFGSDMNLNKPIQERYMMVDDRADRTKIKD